MEVVRVWGCWRRRCDRVRWRSLQQCIDSRRGWSRHSSQDGPIVAGHRGRLLTSRAVGREVELRPPPTLGDEGGRLVQTAGTVRGTEAVHTRAGSDAVLRQQSCGETAGGRLATNVRIVGHVPKSTEILYPARKEGEDGGYITCSSVVTAPANLMRRQSWIRSCVAHTAREADEWMPRTTPNAVHELLHTQSSSGEALGGDDGIIAQ